MNRSINDQNSKLKIFASYIVPHRGAFALDMCLSLAVAVVDLAFPYMTRQSLNSLLPKGLFGAFFAVMGILFVSYLLRAWFQYLITIIGHRMGTLVEADMRRDIFTHMQSLSFSFFDRNRTGVLLSRVTNDLFEIVELAHHGPENLLICGVTLLGSVIILLTVNWKLTCVLIVLLPACILFSVRQRLNMQKANREVKVRTGEINAAIESGISGIRTSKAFTAEKTEDEKFDRANEAFKKSKVSYYRALGLFNAGIEAAIGLMQVAVVSVGGLLVMRGEMDFVPFSFRRSASWSSSWRFLRKAARVLNALWKSCAPSLKSPMRRMLQSSTVSGVKSGSTMSTLRTRAALPCWKTSASVWLPGKLLPWSAPPAAGKPRSAI